MKQKRIMILGASVSQLPMILSAKQLGHHVITVDNIPENIGHRFADQKIDCSTRHYERLCEVAKELKIDAISTFASDIATKSVAFVSEQLALPGCSQIIAETFSNKANFRRFQQQHQINHPDFAIVSDDQDVYPACQRLAAPLIFKPVDTSGSRGVLKVNAISEGACHDAFKSSVHYSHSNTVSIEQFIDGVDVSGDGFLSKGQLFAVISQKYQQGFATTGHRFPCALTEQDQQRVLSEVALVCRKAGYRDGPVDFDVKISDHHVVVIEISPRLGGNAIPELIRFHTGIDLIEMTLRYSLGQRVELPEQIQPVQSCASWIFGAETAGILEHCASIEAMQAEIPELLSCRYTKQPGQRVDAFEHGGNSLGYAVFMIDPEFGYEGMVDKIKAAMKLRISEKLSDDCDKVKLANA